MSSVSDTNLMVTGWGAVSPAGWTARELVRALTQQDCAALPVVQARRDPRAPEYRTRPLPPPPDGVPLPRHPRLRRSSMVARHALAAAMEAVDPEHLAAVHAGDRSLGIVFCVMNGCVQFSRRFYQEVLENPATASPILFPETVFNSPSSHLAAALGTAAVNHTLIGDDACFLSGLAMARQWLEDHVVDSVLVVAAEELDWLSAEALQLFDRQGITAEGGGALLLEREADPDRRSVRLIHLPEPMVYGPRLSRADAVKQIASELRRHLDASADDRHGATLLIDSRRQHTRLDRPEQKAWADWAHPRCSPVERLGDGFAVTGAWQCAAACEAVAEGIADTVLVSATGGTMQAAGAVFCR